MISIEDRVSPSGRKTSKVGEHFTRRMIPDEPEAEDEGGILTLASQKARRGRRRGRLALLGAKVTCIALLEVKFSWQSLPDVAMWKLRNTPDRRGPQATDWNVARRGRRCGRVTLQKESQSEGERGETESGRAERCEK
jgi:hypothetical protein